MDATNYLRDAIINFWLRANPDSVTAPASVWFALHSSTVAADGTGTELSNASYVRKQLSISDPLNTGDATQNLPLTFAFATGIGNTIIVGCSVWNTSTGGTMLMFDNFPTTYTVIAGNTLTFSAGDVDVEVR